MLLLMISSYNRRKLFTGKDLRRRGSRSRRKPLPRKDLGIKPKRSKVSDCDDGRAIILHDTCGVQFRIT